MRIFLWSDDETGNQLGRAVLRAADRGVNISIYKDRIAAVYEYSGGNKQSFLHSVWMLGLMRQGAERMSLIQDRSIPTTWLIKAAQSSRS